MGNVGYCVRCDYPLQYLVESRCPECGTAFDLGDPRTWAREPRHVRRNIAVAASFSGAFCGWALSYASHALYQAYWSPYGHLTDESFWLFWPAATITVWWLFLVLPLLLFASVLRLIRRPLVALAAGTVHGAVGIWLLLGWGPLRGGPWDMLLYLTAWAASVGTVTGLFVSFSLRPSWTRSAVATPRRLLAAWWLAPIVCVALWLSVGWPVVCRVAPNLAYRAGGQTTRKWVLQHILQRVQVGDPSIRLHQLLPAHFGSPAKPVQSGGWSATMHDGWQFSVNVRNGRITHLEF